MTLIDDPPEVITVPIYLVPKPPEIGCRHNSPTHAWRRWRLAGLLVAGWAISIVVATRLDPSWSVHRAALFIHLAGLVAGFGAVLVADMHGLLWLLGRRRLDQLLAVIHALHPMIWGGLLALTVS